MDISKITSYLYVSSKLQAGHMQELPARNIGLAISMIVGQPPPDFSDHACRMVWLQTCDSILIPIPVKELMSGVQAALPVIQSGQSVLVYCAKGRHRSVAMAAAVLIAMGQTACEATQLLRAQRKAADPQAWHISRRIHKFEKYWKNRNTQATNQVSCMEETYANTATALVASIILYMSGAGQWAFGKFRNKQVRSNT